MMTTLWHEVCSRSTAFAENAFAGIESLADWESVLPTRRREFLQCLGLSPTPERCDLRITEYGEFAGAGYRARKIAFQMLPDCWSSGAVYYPEPAPAAAGPAVLYVCGHSSLGSWHYQYHPIMWARRGYVCLIIDTIEQSDNPGEHHAYVTHNMDSRVALGYTPAGGEVWNAMRALDVLAADPHVDADRLGITGVSGGGACSFHTAIADERVRTVSTLCGISSPHDALANEHLHGHCECMYPYNLYQRDISEYAALLAPRPALFCFADDDTLYHAEETTAVVERTRRIYRLFDHEPACGLVTCPGPHGDHVEFDDATAAWFDTHLAGGDRPCVARGDREQPERITSVFNGVTPAPNRVHLLPELLSVRGMIALPPSADAWPAIRAAALRTLPPWLSRPAADTELMPAGEWTGRGRVERVHRGHIGGVYIRLQTVVAAEADTVLLSVANAGETYRRAFAAACAAVDAGATGVAALTPRIAAALGDDDRSWHQANGPWPASGARFLCRGMLLTGTTPVMLTIQDLRVAVDYLLRQPEMAQRRLVLHGRGDGAAAALYAALLDDRVDGVVLEDLVRSHADGSPVLGILRAMDVHHAVGLLAPRPVALVNPGHRNWTFPERVYDRIGCPQHIATGDLRQATAAVLELAADGRDR
jgi:dienelactone hydrolase